MSNNQIFKKILFLLMIIFSSFILADKVEASDSVGAIDPSYKYAWGENLGWLNFGCDNCDVEITDTGVTGYVWSGQFGWMNLAPSGSGVTNNCLGQLGGKAWSTRLGWLDFSGASIDFTGKFTGTAGTLGTKSGRIKFNCDNCDVRTDWRQCSLRASPAQVRINAITDNTVPTISANVTITNEGTVDTEYQYEWCIVTNQNDSCGDVGNIFSASAAKLLVAGENWDTVLPADVPTPGNYFFKFVVHYGVNRSVATQSFSAISPPTGGGGNTGGGGGGGSIPNPVVTLPPILPIDNKTCSGSDFDHNGVVGSADFSILLYFWNTTYPFSNPCIDLNGDKKVNSIDFSIMLSQWGKRLTNI